MKHKLLFTVLAVLAVFVTVSTNAFAREAQPGDDRGGSRIRRSWHFMLKNGMTIDDSLRSLIRFSDDLSSKDKSSGSDFSDDSSYDDNSLGRNGADDLPGDDRGSGGHGADDLPGDDRGSGGHGADDLPGDDRGSGGHGADDLP